MNWVRREDMPENRFPCALVGAASFDADHFSAEHFDKVIAVDGGFSSLCAIGVTPDFALGDFDSLGHVPQGVPIERHPVMKDDSDTALALEWALAHGMREVAVYGALGGRLDHTLATLSALVGAARAGMRSLGVGALLTQWGDFATLWKYFSWSNQTLAMMVLWAGAVYLHRNGFPPIACMMAALPATFMSAVSITYFIQAPECLNMSTSIAYPVGIVVAVVFFGIFIVREWMGHKDDVTKLAA